MAIDFFMDLLYNGFIMRRKNIEHEINQIVVSVSVFMESYNKSIPKGFPEASLENLEKFYKANPVLFKSGRKWSIDKHRKRVMDWLSSRHE